MYKKDRFETTDFHRLNIDAAEDSVQPRIELEQGMPIGCIYALPVGIPIGAWP